MEDGYADVGAVRLAYTQAGAGDAVALLHAGIADRRMWERQIPALAERYRVVAYDMRGFGGSEMVDEPFSNRADLAGLLDALGIDRAHLVACSMGGAVALAFAIEHPEMARSLVLVNSAAPGFVPEGDQFEPPQSEAFVTAFEAGDFDRAAELEAEMWVVGPFRRPEQVARDILDAVREMDVVALATEARRDEFARHLDPAAGARLNEVGCPALVVVGELDMPDMRRRAEHLVAGIPDSALVSIADAAHLPNMERPEEFNRMVLQFLSEAAP